MGLPSASSEFMLDFWQSPPAFVKHTVTDFAMDFRSTFGQIWSIFIQFGRFFASGEATGGLRDSSRHASVISARFCAPKVPTIF